MKAESPSTLFGKIISKGFQIAIHGDDGHGEPQVGQNRLQNWWDAKKTGLGNRTKNAFLSSLGEADVQRDGALFASDMMVGAVEGIKANFKTILEATSARVQKSSTDTRSNYDIIHQYMRADGDPWYSALLKRLGARLISWGIPILTHIGAAVAVHTLERDEAEIPEVKNRFKSIIDGLLAKTPSKVA